jgi:hypothetical protein
METRITNDSSAPLPLRLFVPDGSSAIDVQLWPQEAGTFFGAVGVSGPDADSLFGVTPRE